CDGGGGAAGDPATRQRRVPLAADGARGGRAAPGAGRGGACGRARAGGCECGRQAADRGRGAAARARGAGAGAGALERRGAAYGRRGCADLRRGRAGHGAGRAGAAHRAAGAGRPGERSGCGAGVRRKSVTSMDFGGQVAIVTGGSRGIGRAAVLMLAERGAAVAAGYHTRADAAAEVAAACAGLRGTAEPYQVDVRSRESVDALVAAVLERWGRLDVLINCAGVAAYSPVEDVSVEQWRALLAV